VRERKGEEENENSAICGTKMLDKRLLIEFIALKGQYLNNPG